MTLSNSEKRKEIERQHSSLFQKSSANLCFRKRNIPNDCQVWESKRTKTNDPRIHKPMILDTKFKKETKKIEDDDHRQQEKGLQQNKSKFHNEQLHIHKPSTVLLKIQCPMRIQKPNSTARRIHKPSEKGRKRESWGGGCVKPTPLVKATTQRKRDQSIAEELVSMEEYVRNSTEKIVPEDDEFEDWMSKPLSELIIPGPIPDFFDENDESLRLDDFFSGI